MIEPARTFAENLAQLPPIDGVERIDLIDADGAVIDSIANAPGKKGSLAVYQYLHRTFGTLDAQAAEAGLQLFAEHTADARQRHGAHPNIDRLLAIAAGAPAIAVAVVAAAG